MAQEEIKGSAPTTVGMSEKENIRKMIRRKKKEKWRAVCIFDPIDFSSLPRQWAKDRGHW